MPKPHGAFEVLTPDVIAECWDDILHNKTVPDLYEQLWNLVPKYDNPYRADIEDIGPDDVIGINSLTTWWDKLPEATQIELNNLAVKNT